MIDLWAWNRSDLVRASRAVLAEFSIGTALGITDGVREEWAPWDLTWGEIEIEVKSAVFSGAFR